MQPAVWYTILATVAAGVLTIILVRVRVRSRSNTTCMPLAKTGGPIAAQEPVVSTIGYERSNPPVTQREREYAVEKVGRIVEIMILEGFPWFNLNEGAQFGTPAYKITHPIMQELHSIGEDLNERGGLSLMRFAAELAYDRARERQLSFNIRHLEHAWDYIGEWRA